MPTIARRFLLCLIVVAAIPYGLAAQTETPPNVVIIFADDLGYAVLGA